jgi:hypothetical protein
MLANMIMRLKKLRFFNHSITLPLPCVACAVGVFDQDYDGFGKTTVKLAFCLGSAAKYA